MDRERKLYLVLIALHYFALAMSNIFVNVFLWKINSSLTLLAYYSLTFAIAVLVSFPLCSVFARKTSPMSSLRLGIVLLALAYGVVLLYKENIVHHILELGTLIGVGTSLFVIGQHMQTLDSTDNSNRDRFLFLSSFFMSASGMAAPLVSGYVINSVKGMLGFYIVFFISIIWFALGFVTSFWLKGKKVYAGSYFKEVWKNPTREWRGMYWLSIGMAMAEGTYSTFLVTIMSYSILKNELTLGGYNTVVAFISLLTSIVLAKYSRPDRRMRIYIAGSILLSVSSLYISLYPSLFSLSAYALLSSVGLNLIYTIFDSWTYASIEADADYEKKRLDYLVVREIPLGIGRIIGIGLFLLLQVYFTRTILPISFSLFGSIFLFMIPALRILWKKERQA